MIDLPGAKVVAVTEEQIASFATTPEVAYYYPEWHWRPDDHGWVKSLLLFFDEIALLVPDFKRALPAKLDPVLAGALEEAGLLRLIPPEEFVDAEMTASLATTMVSLIEAGAFDELSPDEGFAELSMSRAGFHGERAVAESVVELLAEKGLARSSRDGFSIPMHPTVRSTYLVLLAQLARRAGDRRGLDLQPTTNRPDAHDVINRTLNLRSMPSKGRVIDFDLQVVSIDLDPVPLDELLDFRQQHRKEHRKYMSDLRTFCAELSQVEDDVDRQRAHADRRAEIEDAAEQLSRRARTAFSQPKTVATFGLGLIGASVSIAAGNLVGGGISIASQLLHLLPDRKDDTVYSYLFSAQRSFE